MGSTAKRPLNMVIIQQELSKNMQIFSDYFRESIDAIFKPSIFSNSLNTFFLHKKVEKTKKTIDQLISNFIKNL